MFLKYIVEKKIESACKEREGKTLTILYLCKYVHIKIFLETAFWCSSKYLSINNSVSMYNF